MAFPVKWSHKAKSTYENVIDYLSANWTEKEIIKFVKRTEAVIESISYQPYLFNASGHKKIRKAVINKQNSLFYLVRESEIFLLRFWDNRMDPKRNEFR